MQIFRQLLEQSTMCVGMWKCVNAPNKRREKKSKIETKSEPGARSLTGTRLQATKYSPFVM